MVSTWKFENTNNRENCSLLSINHHAKNNKIEVESAFNVGHCCLKSKDSAIELRERLL